MANKSTTEDNVSVFENFVIGQLLTFFWDDPKTEIQMLDIKRYDFEKKQVYDCYKHFFACLARGIIDSMTWK